MLIAGAGGLLGSAFRIAFPKALALSRSELNPRNFVALALQIRQCSPTVIVNAAAYTNVEQAETNWDECYQVNTLLPQLLGDCANSCGALLVYFGSTGCYGEGPTPHTDFDALQPSTHYHRSKMLGETAVREATFKHLILRLGWLFGGTNKKPDFVRARIGELQKSTNVFADYQQQGNPTFVDAVVSQTMRLVNVGLTGTFNCVSFPAVSRLEYVKAVAAAGAFSCAVTPVEHSYFNRKANVSLNESAANTKLQMLGLDEMPDWRISLQHYMQVVRNLS